MKKCQKSRTESITWTSNRALNQILDLCPDSIEKSLTKMVVPTRTHIPFRRGVYLREIHANKEKEKKDLDAQYITDGLFLSRFWIGAQHPYRRFLSARDALQEGNTKLLKSNKVSYGNSELGTLRAGTARIIIDVVAYFTPDVIFQLPSTELSFATLLGSRKTCGSPLPSNSDKRGT
uniref:Uncharacterized protein n=1 Tax=Vespula pensylvanica TaxID=30213 RepID=A0A834PDN9_VESPE|nr:hypothetical protein H0235_003790 [Vespula pensylvanica]